MNKTELIKLLKPCEELCKGCGAKCCYNQENGKPCTRLKDGLCTDRNLICLLHSCSKMEKNFPEIVKILKKERGKLFPFATSLGIEVKLDCQGL
jgi:hypothetical protein